MQGIEVREGRLSPGVLANLIKVVCRRRLFVVPSILLFLLFLNDVLLVGLRGISDGLRGVLPPVVLGPWMFAVVSEVCLILPVVGLAGLAGLATAVVVDEQNISLVNSPLSLCSSQTSLLGLLLSWLGVLGVFGGQPAPGHLLHQGLGGRDGDPVTVVYWNVEKL